MAASSTRVRTPQQARSRRTRQSVLEAAQTCFSELGYDGVTTAGIADRAGIAVGTLYGYFRDKREILLELCDSAIQEMSDHIVTELDAMTLPGADPRSAARALIDAVFHSDTVQPGVQRVMWERYFKDPDVQARIASIREHTRVAVAAFCRTLQERGEARDGDPDVVAFVIVNSVQWNSVLTSLESTPDERDRAAIATADMIERFVFRDD